MRGGSILVQLLPTGIWNVYKVEECLSGGLGEISVVKMYSLSHNNTVDGRPELISVPWNMLTAMFKAGILKVYNQAE